jgi:hypothetical protein
MMTYVLNGKKLTASYKIYLSNDDLHGKKLTAWHENIEMGKPQSQNSAYII